MFDDLRIEGKPFVHFYNLSLSVRCDKAGPAADALQEYYLRVIAGSCVKILDAAHGQFVSWDQQHYDYEINLEDKITSELISVASEDDIFPLYDIKSCFSGDIRKQSFKDEELAALERAKRAGDSKFIVHVKLNKVYSRSEYEKWKRIEEEEDKRYEALAKICLLTPPPE